MKENKFSPRTTSARMTLNRLDILIDSVNKKVNPGHDQAALEERELYSLLIPMLEKVKSLFEDDYRSPSESGLAAQKGEQFFNSLQKTYNLIEKLESGGPRYKFREEISKIKQDEDVRAVLGTVRKENDDDFNLGEKLDDLLTKIASIFGAKEKVTFFSKTSSIKTFDEGFEEIEKKSLGA